MSAERMVKNLNQALTIYHLSTNVWAAAGFPEAGQFAERRDRAQDEIRNAIKALGDHAQRGEDAAHELGMLQADIAEGIAEGRSLEDVATDWKIPVLRVA